MITNRKNKQSKNKTLASLVLQLIFLHNIMNWNFFSQTKLGIENYFLQAGKSIRMRRASTTGTSRAGRFSGTHRSRKKMTKPVPTSSATSARPTSLTTTSTSCCRRRRRRRRRRQRRLRPCRRAARRRPSSSSRKKPKARNTNVGVCRRRRTTPTTRRRWSG